MSIDAVKASEAIDQSDEYTDEDKITYLVYKDVDFFSYTADLTYQFDYKGLYYASYEINSTDRQTDYNNLVKLFQSQYGIDYVPNDFESEDLTTYTAQWDTDRATIIIAYKIDHGSKSLCVSYIGTVPLKGQITATTAFPKPETASP